MQVRRLGASGNSRAISAPRWRRTSPGKPGSSARSNRPISRRPSSLRRNPSTSSNGWEAGSSRFRRARKRASSPSAGVADKSSRTDTSAASVRSLAAAKARGPVSTPTRWCASSITRMSGARRTLPDRHGYHLNRTVELIPSEALFPVRTATARKGDPAPRSGRALPDHQ